MVVGWFLDVLPRQHRPCRRLIAYRTRSTRPAMRRSVKRYAVAVHRESDCCEHAAVTPALVDCAENIAAVQTAGGGVMAVAHASASRATRPALLCNWVCCKVLAHRPPGVDGVVACVDRDGAVGRLVNCNDCCGLGCACCPLCLSPSWFPVSRSVLNCVYPALYALSSVGCRCTVAAHSVREVHSGQQAASGH